MPRVKQTMVMGKYPNYGRIWTQADDELLKTFYADKSVPIGEIAQSLGRTKASCTTRAITKFGIYRTDENTFKKRAAKKSAKVGKDDARLNVMLEDLKNEISPNVESVSVPEVPKVSMKDADFEDTCFIRLCRGEQGTVKAFVKFKGGWSIDKITHTHAMTMLKDLPVGIVQDV